MYADRAILMTWPGGQCHGTAFDADESAVARPVTHGRPFGGPQEAAGISDQV